MPGWITPAIPLTLAFAAGYDPGPDRVHAVMALQFSIAFIFFFMGITGLANKVVAIVPASMRAGILMGAGISAMVSVIKPDGGRMQNVPVFSNGLYVSKLSGVLLRYFQDMRKTARYYKVLLSSACFRYYRSINYWSYHRRTGNPGNRVGFDRLAVWRGDQTG